jgi:CRP-like cAMP-binding protein
LASDWIRFGIPDPAAFEDSIVLSLRSVPLFSALPVEALRSLATGAKRRRYEPRQALFRIGDPSDWLWVICSGHVQATSRASDGREFVLHVGGPGEAPGHLDLIDGHPRLVDAVAVDEVETLLLPASTVRQILLAHPEALMSFAADLAGIVRILGETAADLVFLDLPARVAKLLLARAPYGSMAELGITQGELAAQLGVARQSLNRTLSAMQRDGLIRVAGMSVELVDRMALARLASSGRSRLSR